MKNVAMALALILLAAGPLWAQCAMCQQTLEQGSVGLRGGLQLTMYGMLGLFYGLAGLVVWMVYRAARRHDASWGPLVGDSREG